MLLRPALKVSGTSETSWAVAESEQSSWFFGAFRCVTLIWAALLCLLPGAHSEQQLVLGAVVPLVFITWRCRNKRKGERRRRIRKQFSLSQKPCWSFIADRWSVKVFVLRDAEDWSFTSLCDETHFKLLQVWVQRAQETSLRWWEFWGRCPHRGQVTSVSFFLSSYVKGRKLPRKRYSVNLCEVIYLHVCHTEPKVESMKFQLFQHFSHVSMEKRKRQNCWVNKSLFFPKGGSHQDSLIDHPPALGNTPGKASEIFEDIMKYSRVCCSASSQHVCLPCDQAAPTASLRGCSLH